LSVWFCIPSARPPEQVEPVLVAWSERGYKIAVFRDCVGGFDFSRLLPSVSHGQSAVSYPGYAKSINDLCKEVLAHDPSCDWIVTGGDDTLPDPNHTAEEIADNCSAYFANFDDDPMSTFGVMQPTGDRFAGGCIDRIAGSPWLGRSFCERVNGGRGPFWPEYTHCFGDEELQNVAIKLGVFWQRPDLIHKHMHFMRRDDSIDSPAVARPIPQHLIEANSRPHWDKYKAIFEARKAAGFPGHEPL